MSTSGAPKRPRGSPLVDQLSPTDLHLLTEVMQGQQVPIDKLSVLARVLVDSPNGHTQEQAFRHKLEVLDRPTHEALMGALLAQDPNAPAPIAAPLTQRATDLLARELPEPRWAIPGLLPEGLSILAGRPKFGKSWIALQLCLAVACGGRALSQVAVEPGDALFLGLEDTERRVQDRLRLLLGGAPCPSRLDVPTDPRAWQRLDVGGLDQLEQWLDHHPAARLIVLDTWQKLRPRAQRGGDLYQESYDAAARLKAVADARHVAILPLHHTRKALAGAVEDFVDTVLGDTGLPAAADTILVLQRARGSRDAVLYGTGRDVLPELEEGRGLQWDDLTGWSLEGKAADIQMTKERRKVREVLSVAGKPQSPAELAPLLDKTRNATKYLLWSMSKDQELTVSGGCYGLPGWTASV